MRVYLRQADNDVERNYMQAASRLPQPSHEADVAVLPPRKILPPETTTGAIETALGEHITAGSIDLHHTGDAWTATMSRLEQPGVVAAMFFAQGLREVTLRLADGRSAPARIGGTSFTAASERVCELIGLELLA
jgi:hypothetical protein